MRNALVVLSSLLASLSTSVSLAEENTKVAQEIKQRIPLAAAMQRKDFNELATGARLPNPSDYQDQSLTLLLFTFSYQPRQQTDQFRWLTKDRLPKPVELAKELSRGLGGGRNRVSTTPVTMIHGNRITEVTCEVKGTRATGTVSFKVPKMYEGEVEYLAEKQGKFWRIVELKMTDYNIHIRRNTKGEWRTSQPK